MSAIARSAGSGASTCEPWREGPCPAPVNTGLSLALTLVGLALLVWGVWRDVREAR